MDYLHLLRPFWLLAYIPWLLMLYLSLPQKNVASAWKKLCDPHLLPYITEHNNFSTTKKRLSVQNFVFYSGFISAFFMILSLVGLSWSKLPVPTYNRVYPQVVLLDLSSNMLEQDLAPSRLEVAKFKLHDLFSHKKLNQIGLIAYSGEPFIVSPLTDDGKTIRELVDLLSPDLLPVNGNNLSAALQEARALLASSGFQHGHVLVLTGLMPDSKARAQARELAKSGIYVSILPLVESSGVFDKFSAFARAGHGKNLSLSNNNQELEQWLALSSQAVNKKAQNLVAVFRDDGRWFIIPALLFLLPMFRRNE